MISWLHVGDLHMDAADGWIARDRLRAIVAEVNARLVADVDFLFLPGDNANHATPEQYRAITDTLRDLVVPYRVIPGDHDFEAGDLTAYDAAFPPINRPEVEVIAGHRCIFVDMISAGAGGPDFRLTMHHRNRLRDELARAEAEGQTPLMFMHAYPGDLAAHGVTIARQLADARVAFVDTGHTHYNELLNDGHVVYGATRSTAQIEEDGGVPGYALVTVYEGVPSWRFKPIGGRMAVRSDRRARRPAHGDASRAPPPGSPPGTGRDRSRGLWRAGRRRDPGGVMIVAAGDGVMHPMVAQPGAGLWRATLMLAAGLHEISVVAGEDRDTVQVLVRGTDDIPRRGPAMALGHDVHAIGPWPEHGILGTQLGPNTNGARP